jgi:hypothetical protein
MYGGSILFILGTESLVKLLILNTELVTKLLEFAFAAAYAGETLAVVGGKDKLQSLSSGIQNLRAVRLDLCALIGSSKRIHAGSYQSASLGRLNETDTAVADFIGITKEAQRRDLYARLMGSVQDRCSFRNGHRDSVNFHINHFNFICHSCFLPYCLLIALNLQFAMQAPHFTHLAESIAIEASLWPGAM